MLHHTLNIYIDSGIDEFSTILRSHFFVLLRKWEGFKLQKETNNCVHILGTCVFLRRFKKNGGSENPLT